VFIGAMSTHYFVGICIAGLRRRGRGSEPERHSVDYVFSDYKLGSEASLNPFHINGPRGSTLSA